MLLHALSKREKMSVMGGVVLAMLLSALDQTIVATALPKITQELNGLEHLSWLFTAYMLASTITVPIYGKLSDIYGRKYFYLGGIVVFLLGSILCGQADTMTQLIIFRGLQGIGGGAIMVNSIAVIGDLFPPEERAKWQGVIGGVFGLASVAGPLLGGWLTDAVNWRWVFYVNLPLGVISLIVISKVLPRILPDRKDKPSIDYLGALTLTIALVSLLMACVWGGVQYAWSSWQIISLFAAAVVFIGLFIVVERKHTEPIIPLSLFKSRTVTVSTITTFLIAVGMFGAILYIPLFAQAVVGVNATYSGMILTPMMIGLIAASAVSGQIISKTGKYKILSFIGVLIIIGALYLLSSMSVDTTKGGVIFNMVVMGLGLGVTMPIFNIVVQSAVDHSQLGVATATTQLFRSVGGTVGGAVLGTVMNNRLAEHIVQLRDHNFITSIGQAMPQFSAQQFDANSLQALLLPASHQKIVDGLSGLSQNPGVNATMLQTTFADFVSQAQVALADAITHTYVWAMVIMSVSVLVLFFLPEISIRRNTKSSALAEAGGELEVELSQPEPADEPELGRVEKK